MEVEGEDEPAVRGKERTTLEQRLGARLALVQSVMAREQVLWNSGYLAMPQVRAWVNFLIHEPPPPPPGGLSLLLMHPELSSNSANSITARVYVSG